MCMVLKVQLKKRLTMCNFHERGFTLIELLVVMAVLSILIGIGINTFTIAQKKARDTKRKADLRTIQTALEAYRINTGSYPTQPDTNDASIIDGSTTLLTGYLPAVPSDPLSQNGCNSGWPWSSSNCFKYFYKKIATPASGVCEYVLIATLEDANDRDSSYGVTPAPSKNCTFTPSTTVSKPYYYVGNI